MKTMRRLMVVEFDEEFAPGGAAFSNHWLDATGLYQPHAIEDMLKEEIEDSGHNHGYFGNFKVIMLVNQGERNGA